jgi:hypothetical protein
MVLTRLSKILPFFGGGGDYSFRVQSHGSVSEREQFFLLWIKLHALIRLGVSQTRNFAIWKIFFATWKIFFPVLNLMNLRKLRVKASITFPNILYIFQITHICSNWSCVYR